MPDEKPEPYPLEEPGGEQDAPDQREAPPPQRSGKIESPGLLSDFPEDADFDRDPEVDRVIAGPQPGRQASRDEPGPEGEPFVKPGFPDARSLAIAGAVLLIGAMIATGVNVGTVASVLLTLYNTLLHTGTGVVALFAAAVLSERRLGPFEVAAARMFTAVAAFALLLNLRIDIVGEGYVIEQLLFATVAYVLLVSALFRLWNWRSLAYVVGSHFALWLVVYVGMLLSAHVHAATTAAN